MTADADVVVVGGGPVGLAAAIEAALRGMDVLLVEPRAGAVDKACGEGVMPGALGALRALGVDPPGRDFTGIRYVSEATGRTAVAGFRGPAGRGVRRTTLHDSLRARAQLLGVPVLRDRVVGLDSRPGSVRLHLRDGAEFVAGHVLAADGLHSTVRRALRVAGPPAARRRFGLRRHFAVAPWSRTVDVHWARDAEAYVTPVAPDLVGVAVLSSQPAPWAASLAQFPALTAHLGDAMPVTRARGAGPLRQSVRRRRIGRTLLLGDAAGYVDALTGEGLAVGLASARLAVGCVAAGRLDRYEAQWRAATRRSRFITAAVLWAAQAPGVRPAVVPACGRWPSGFAALVNLLA